MNKAFDFHIVPGKKSTSLMANFCPQCGNSCLEWRNISGYNRQQCTQCDYVFFHNPRACVAVMITDKSERVLLGKTYKPGDKRHNTWSFVNGFLEDGQNFIEAAHQEALEETGLKVKLQTLVGLVSTSYTITPILKAQALTTEIKPTDNEFSEFLWIGAEDKIPKMSFEREEVILQRYFDQTLKEWPLESPKL